MADNILLENIEEAGELKEAKFPPGYRGAVHANMVGSIVWDNVVLALKETRLFRFLEHKKDIGILAEHLVVPVLDRDERIRLLIKNGFIAYENTFIRADRNHWCELQLKQKGDDACVIDILVATKNNKLLNYVAGIKQELVQLFGEIGYKNRYMVLWYYWAGEIRCSEMIITLDEKFYKEAYPYLDSERIFRDFLESNENILIIKGPPGTGKTRFVRWFLQSLAPKRDYKNKLDAPLLIYVRDKQLLMHDAFYNCVVQNYLSALRENRYCFLVIEDMDYQLMSRTDGNDAMTYLLGLADGLIPLKLKCIFTTNLASIRHIDEALLRPGRLYDLIETRKLKSDEAVRLAEKINGRTIDFKDDITLAEVFRRIEKK